MQRIIRESTALSLHHWHVPLCSWTCVRHRRDSWQVPRLPHHSDSPAGCLHVVELSQSVILLLFQECGDKAGLRNLIEKPVFNTIAIANLFKKALRPLLAADEKTSAKLVHLYCMAVEFLDQPMTEDEMKAAFDSAHAADYDAIMTAKVFEAMLRFSDLQGDMIDPILTVTNSERQAPLSG